MNDLLGIGIFILYIAIGVFFNFLNSDDDFSFVLVAFWPLAIVIFLIMVVTLMIPRNLALWIRNRKKKGR